MWSPSLQTSQKYTPEAAAVEALTGCFFSKYAEPVAEHNITLQLQDFITE